MMRCRFLVGWGILGLVSMGYAQTIPPGGGLSTFDRPGLADAPYLPKQGSFQVELGSGWSGTSKDGQPLKPGVLLRYAQSSAFEWRAQWNYAPPLGILDDFLSNYQRQLVTFGGKVRCGHQKGLVPDWGLMGNVMVDPRYQRAQGKGSPVGGDLYLVTMHNFPYGLSVNTNWGLGLFPSSPSLVPLGAVALNWAAGGSWGFYGEVFGFGGQGERGQRGWDMGVTCLLRGEKAQLDLSWMDPDVSQKGGGSLLLGYSLNFSRSR